MKLKHSMIILLSIILLSTNPADAYKKKRAKKYKKQSYTYVIPRRSIEVTPYFSFLAVKNLYENYIEDQTGFGGGLNIRTQVYGNFGYLIDASLNNLDINNGEYNSAAICIGGLYYSYKKNFGDFRFDLGYGAISAGDNAMTIFLPSIEFHKTFYKRISYIFKIGYLIPNDWIVDQDFKEHYTSVSLSCGIAIIF